GGAVEVLTGQVPDRVLVRFLACMDSTVNCSIVYSPFQGLFPGIVRRTCGIDRPEMVHIVARLRSEVVGYHTFVKTGNGLRMIHGAFDRTLRSTCHAYESVIVRTAAYALERGLAYVHFGPVMNETKRRMMNDTRPCALYFYSRYSLVRLLFPPIFRRTKMQSPALLAFSGTCGPNKPFVSAQERQGSLR
ncbi:MAG: GNAT family N-acetyltransferase, partial [Candidatus Hydrogenedentes bacterium]|nr:GNAT family N-acetyltransferase [Candidatus Hydrogenedentota bacterium]